MWNQIGNKARQTHPKFNETHAKANMIYPNPSTTYPNHCEIYSKPNERDKNEEGKSASSMTLQFCQVMQSQWKTPRTLQAHCQAQTAVKVIEKSFIGLAKELAIPSHVSPKGLLGLADAQNKLCSVSSGQKNAFMENWIKFDTFTPRPNQTRLLTKTICQLPFPCWQQAA